MNARAKKSASALWLVLGLLALCLALSALLLAYAYGAQRHRASVERPGEQWSITLNVCREDAGP